MKYSLTEEKYFWDQVITKLEKQLGRSPREWSASDRESFSEELSAFFRAKILQPGFRRLVKDCHIPIDGKISVASSIDRICRGQFSTTSIFQKNRFAIFLGYKSAEDMCESINLKENAGSNVSKFLRSKVDYIAYYEENLDQIEQKLVGRLTDIDLEKFILEYKRLNDLHIVALESGKLELMRINIVRICQLMLNTKLIGQSDGSSVADLLGDNVFWNKGNIIVSFISIYFGTSTSTSYQLLTKIKNDEEIYISDVIGLIGYCKRNL